MAREAPPLFDRSDQELERRRQALSEAVIWGEGGASGELEEIERELDRRARLRAEERRTEAQAARDEAWRKMQRQEAERRAADEALKAAEEKRRRAEQERLRAEEERLRTEDERRRVEEDERARAEQEHVEKQDELRRLAAEQLQTARLLDFGTKRIVELAAEYVEREDAMHTLAAEAFDDADESDRFSQAGRLLGASLRARLAGIPSLRLKPDTSHNGNGGSNGKRSSLEGGTRAALGDLLTPPEDD